MPDLAIVSPVREIRPGDERLMRNVRRSGVPQDELVSKQEFTPVRKAVVSHVQPFLPRRPVLEDVERVDADLGPVEGDGGEVVWERRGEVARAVVVYGRGGSRLGISRDQGREGGQEEAQVSKGQHRRG